ncbi:MAG: LytR C-terminal domain-containing protein [Frankia sp.]|nr:LytR C-terminal domain-containing protein [Frankia sp.]
MSDPTRTPDPADPRRGGRHAAARVGRLRVEAVAAAIAIVAITVGILLLNLVNGSSGDAAAAPAATTSQPAATEAPTMEPAQTPSAAPETTPPPGPSTPSPEPTTRDDEPAGPRAFAPVVILNHSRIAGLAEAAREPVEDAGFTVARTGNFHATYNTPVTTVFYPDGLEDAARTLRDLVAGVEDVVPISDTNIEVYDPDKLILVVTRDFPTPTPAP